MKFGPVRIANAAGCILVHHLDLPEGALDKGCWLTEDDVTRLAATGLAEIVVARLEADDVGEDAAAFAVARAITGEGISLSAARTGRCNLMAMADGIVLVNADTIDAINRIDAAITVATVPKFAAVTAGQILATVKIIPFAAPAAAVARCIAMTAGTDPLHLRPFRRHCAGLVQTTRPGLKASMLAKTVRTTTARLSALGSNLVSAVTVVHEVAAVAVALAEHYTAGCNPILVLGASAIADRRDVIPAAIERLGGEVVHFGMPVDPGNLLLLARIGTTRVIGLPGCARSSKPNGFDWVLQRLLAGLSVGSEEIMAMGVGGLLNEVAGRPLPRQRATMPEPRSAPTAANAFDESSPAPWSPVAALVMAAGRGNRFGAEGKLLARFRDQPLVLAAVNAGLQSRASPVVVVAGYQRAGLAAALAGLPIQFLNNPDYADGLSTSLRAGLAALPETIEAVVVLLGDMPLVRAAHVDRLIAAFEKAGNEGIFVACHDGRRGHPVLWPRRYFTALAALRGDRGGRDMLIEHAAMVHEIDVGDGAVLVDVDDAAMLAELDMESSGDAGRSTL